MNRWIDVNDRLPDRLGLDDDETEYVLVAERASDCTHWIGVCGYDINGWSEWDNFGVVSTRNITHWMPFPEPPEGRLDMEMD